MVIHLMRVTSLIILTHPVERWRNDVRDVHDVWVEFGDGLRDLAEGPRPTGLHVVKQVVDQRREVRLQQVQERLCNDNFYVCTLLSK